jgi:uroporphyrinogen III methyltransferase/synthase
LADEGAEVIEIPTIEITPLPLDKKGKGILDRVDRYDWIVLSSANAVEWFMTNLASAGKSTLDLGDAKIACVGPSTAKALRSFGVKPNLVPNDYKQEGLVAAFKKLTWKGKRVLFARGKEGRDLLNDFLRKKGAHVDLWALYENKVPADARPKVRELFLKKGGVDLLTFASSSSVDHFYELFTPAERKKWLSKLPVAVIGPVTGTSAKKWGVRKLIQPSKYTLSDLVEVIVKWARRNRPSKY